MVKPLYSLRDVRVRVGGREILSVPQLAFSRGELIAIGGPNGAGKSTLLSILSGMRTEYDGACDFCEREIRAWPRRKFARKVAVVLQNRPVAFPFTVEQVVSMGRTPHACGWFDSTEDTTAVEQVLARTGLTSLRSRDFRTLSGGEQQRAILASALAQQPQVLLLDEPTAYLDLRHQIALYRLLAELRDGGVLAIAITHDLNLAAAYADCLLILHRGEIVQGGAPETVMTSQLIRDVFQVEAELHRNEAGKVWLRFGD